jgi:photosystem II stability/assembly factor-like uncharacterized protein
VLLASLVGAMGPSQAAAQGFNALTTQDGVDVWAVGDAGLVYRSLDGGAIWGSYPMGSVDHNAVAAKGTRVWVVDDGGAVWKSTNSGFSFGSSSPAGAVDLNAICFADNSTGWIAGNAGTILRTTDAGDTWSAQTSGTGVNLYCVRFSSLTDGWACGASGTVLRTTDGGANWTVSTPFAFTKALYDIDFDGSTVYMSGTYSFLGKSTDGGANWTTVNLWIDSQSDVNGVEVLPGGTLWLCGGGGFLRKSTNGASSWTYPQHNIVSGLTDVVFFDANKGWACTEKSKNVARTTDGGTTWTIPGGGAFSYSWSQKLSAGATTIRGDAFDIDPINRDRLYVVQGVTVYRSTNRGDTWASVGTIAGGGTKTNSFYVSPTNPDSVWVAAVGSTDRIARTTNAGATWTAELTKAFTEYGMPLDQDPNDPNTLYFCPEDGHVWKSTDFGDNWTDYSAPGFRSPCDVVVVAGQPNTIFVGDGVTGSGNGEMFRSTDGGANFASIYLGSGSEIPTIGSSWLDPNVAHATHWSSGGVRRTTNMGASWTSEATTGSAWGCDVAKDDPYVAMYGVYSGGNTYLTTNNGTSFASTSLSGTNYAILLYDRGTFLAHEASGVYKATVTQTDMPVNNAQLVTLLVPNGAETWQYNEVRAITWTMQNVPAVKLEYQTSGAGPWQLITASTPGPAGSYAWSVPNDPTAQAMVRVSDAGDASPLDASNAVFSIVVPSIATTEPSLDYGDQPIGSSISQTLHISNPGTATLVISSITVQGGGPFSPNRTSFSILAGQSDTVEVTFSPTAIQSESDNLLIASNAPATPISVPLTGAGLDTIALSVLIPDGGEQWQYNTQQNVTWSSNLVNDVKIEYEASSGGPWIEIAASVPASPNSFAWTIPNDPTTDARVRVSDASDPGRFDMSTAAFSILVQAIDAQPASIDYGSVSTAVSAGSVVTVANPGTAPLAVSSIACDSAAFVPSRTSFVVAPASSETLTVFFSPLEERPYAGTLAIVSDAPSPNAAVSLAGVGVAPVGVGTAALPTRFELRGSHPNPFGDQGTMITYALPRESLVRLVVFNTSGQEVATLFDGRQGPGVHTVGFPGPAGVRPSVEMPSGVYFYRLTAEGFTETKRMVLVK